MKEFEKDKRREEEKIQKDLDKIMKEN